MSSSAVSLVSVDSLKTDTSPRLHGVNEEHVSLLVEVGAVLPPILVHRQTMRVIDGVHRLRAAILRGDREIRVRFFDGDEDAAFILSVSANLAHGLPLSLADRRGAAERIIERHPAWSDRAIAKVTGLSADAVANVRRRSTVGNRQLNARVGRDGRVRPLDATAGRIRAGELFAARPEATLREVAREAGIAVGTARDVRDRVQRGVDLVSTGRRVSERHTAAKPPGDARTARDRAAEAAAGVDGLLSILDSLKRDPSLRFTDSGRRLLRWLASHTPRHELDTGLAAAVPPHSATLVAELARRNAVIWQGFAETIEQRSRQVI
ncbi:MAG: ParB N-terminal domain-containing protein [Saccharothrix sp.]|nr:ParB N-terminal domain-containing protein [Saccharothrix sp.]